MKSTALYRSPYCFVLPRDRSFVAPAALRKVRWGVRGRGKRGGVRVIYYWDDPSDTIYLLLIYKKVQQDDLTPQQIKILRRLVREELT